MSVKKRLSGGVSEKMARTVIATYGNDCWLNLPGCNHMGTTTDHILPYTLGGPTVLWNLRRACKHCNSTRGARVVSGIGATIHAVIGPPAGGKTTYVNEHKKPGAMVIDFDQMAQSILPDWPSEHDAPEYARNIAQGMWSVAYRRAVTMAQTIDVWLIKTIPTTLKSPQLLDEWIALNYDITVCDPGKQVIQYRLKEAGRNAYAYQGMANWYSLGITQDIVTTKIQARQQQMASLGLLTSQASPGDTHRPRW